MKQQLGEVMAERRLERAGEGAEPVVVRIGRPVEDLDGDWVCPFQITGRGDDTVYAAAGIDSVQALVLGLQMIRAQLDDHARTHPLTWLDGSDLGF